MTDGKIIHFNWVKKMWTGTQFEKHLAQDLTPKLDRTLSTTNTRHKYWSIIKKIASIIQCFTHIKITSQYLATLLSTLTVQWINYFVINYSCHTDTTWTTWINFIGVKEGGAEYRLQDRNSYRVADNNDWLVHVLYFDWLITSTCTYYNNS